MQSRAFRRATRGSVCRKEHIRGIPLRFVGGVRQPGRVRPFVCVLATRNTHCRKKSSFRNGGRGFHRPRETEPDLAIAAWSLPSASMYATRISSSKADNNNDERHWTQPKPWPSIESRCPYWCRKAQMRFHPSASCYAVNCKTRRGGFGEIQRP